MTSKRESSFASSLVSDDLESLADPTAGLISDDASLQKLATQQGSLELVTKLLATIEGQSEGGELSLSIIERGREVCDPLRFL
jgi:hypothetical protein